MFLVVKVLTRFTVGDFLVFAWIKGLAKINIFKVGQRGSRSHVQGAKRIDNKMVVELEYSKEQGSTRPRFPTSYLTSCDQRWANILSGKLKIITVHFSLDFKRPNAEKWTTVQF